MNGVLIVDKPSGITSHDVVKKVKRLLKANKVGHTGTLDPMVTGVLPVCINEATKIVQFLTNDDKEYHGHLRLGIETDTQDITGRIIKKSDRIEGDHKKIIDTFYRFKGNIRQKPPAFSAIKHKGVPLYKSARKGIFIDCPEREIHISKINVLKIDLPHISFEVSCSKGTYIRTLCSDIGKSLGCGAHLVSLKRIRSGNFHIRDALSLEDVESLIHKKAIGDNIIPLRMALSQLPQIQVDNVLAKKIRQGKQISIKDLEGVPLSQMRAGEWLTITSLKDDLIAVAESLMNYPFVDNKDECHKACRLIRVFNT